MVFKDFNLIYPDRVEKGTLLVDHGVMKRVNNDEIPSQAEIRDGAFSLYLSPGFIDVHIHGAGGADTMDATREALNMISTTLCRYGTTSFLPTTMTQAPDKIRGAVQAIKDNLFKVEGAQMIGIHLEGPFINVEAMGAQDPEFVAPPAIDTFKQLVGQDEDFITTVTLAPEMPGAGELIGYLRARQINAAIGHTNASYEEAMAGIHQGCNHATHLFNTMPPFHHREPGTIGAVLDTDITAETIADGIHVAWPMLRTAYKVKGIERMILVTDAMMACGMGEGDYSLGGQSVTVKDGAARLDSGALAGSVLTLDQAVRNVLHNTDLALFEVIRMASWNPAMLCGVGKNKGRIGDGFDADLIIFDEDITIQEVYIKGRRVK